MNRNEITVRRRKLLERIMTEGAEAAYEAALDLCRDKNAPSQARSAAANSILRAGGYFDKQDDPARAKEPHEMSSEELTAAIARLEKQARGEDDDNGIFD